ncbi:MAG: ribonuclease E/G [Lachnospiraceae bacterium]|nr:ribonuclease E/G [Lachnospiraceae bacterium]
MTRAVITTCNNIQYLLIYEDNNLTECHPLINNNSIQIGNIYIGRVEKVVKNIQSAFIRLDEDHIGYLPLNDKSARVLNRTLPKGLPSIAEGDKILVQVEQEALKMKQARVTGNISLAGNYAALDLLNGMVGVSNKIHNAERVEELKALVPADIPYGVIFRTACEQAENDAIQAELQQLTTQMDQIMHRAEYERNTGLIQGGKPEYLAIMEEYGWTRIDEIQTDNKVIYEELYATKKFVASKNIPSGQNYVQNNESEVYQPRLLYYEDEYPLYKLLNLESEIAHLLDKRVWLKSGGFLVIEPTEAMVVIDVNTGKSIGKKRQEEHLLKVNEEAAVEIAKQLRLRNLSGIILVDFINMKQPESRERLIRTLKTALRKDKVPSRFVDVTALELYEITRKKIRRPLYEMIG